MRNDTMGQKGGNKWINPRFGGVRVVRSMTLPEGLDMGVKTQLDFWIKNLVYDAGTYNNRKPKEGLSLQGV